MQNILRAMQTLLRITSRPKEVILLSNSSGRNIAFPKVAAYIVLICRISSVSCVFDTSLVYLAAISIYLGDQSPHFGETDIGCCKKIDPEIYIYVHLGSKCTWTNFPEFCWISDIVQFPWKPKKISIIH